MTARDNRHYRDLTRTQSGRRGIAGSVLGGGRCREGVTEHALFVPAALHRGWNPHRFAVLRDGAAGDINARPAQSFHDRVVGKDRCGRLGVDQLRWVTDGLRQMRFAAAARRSAVKKYFSSGNCRDWSPYVVGGHTRHRRFMHLNGVPTRTRLSGRKCATPWVKKPSAGVRFRSRLSNCARDQCANQPGRAFCRQSVVTDLSPVHGHLRRIGVIDLIDRTRGRGVAVELDRAARRRDRPHVNIGTMVWVRAEANKAGLWIDRRISDHIR